MDRREEQFWELVDEVIDMGYPESFGIEIARILRTEKMLSRMIKYLRGARPTSAEASASGGRVSSRSFMQFGTRVDKSGA